MPSATHLHTSTFFLTQTTGMWKDFWRSCGIVTHHGRRWQTFGDFNIFWLPCGRCQHQVVVTHQGWNRLARNWRNNNGVRSTRDKHLMSQCLCGSGNARDKSSRDYCFYRRKDWSPCRVASLRYQLLLHLLLYLL